MRQENPQDQPVTAFEIGVGLRAFIDGYGISSQARVAVAGSALGAMEGAGAEIGEAAEISWARTGVWRKKEK